MGRVLLFKVKDICYSSLYTFTDCLFDALRRMGHDVDVYDISKSVNIRSFLSKSYDAVIDFNSTFPEQKLDNGVSIVRSFQGPFYNYLLDHPLYYHTQLSVPVPQNVICIDRRHAFYVQKYYPEVQSVRFMPLGMMPAEEARIRPLKERPIDLLFTGTYTPFSFVEHKLSQVNPDARHDIFEILGYMKGDTGLPMEDAMQQFLAKRGKTIPDKMFRQFMYYYYLADTAAAAWVREYVIEMIAESGIPLTVCGHSWEMLRRQKDNRPYSNMTVLPEVSYEESLNLSYDAKILLNIMPWFKDGIHDRVLTAMGHGCVCCSDETGIMNELFAGQYLNYQIPNVNELPSMLQRALSKSSELQNVVFENRRFVTENMSWDSVVSSLFSSN